VKPADQGSGDKDAPKKGPAPELVASAHLLEISNAPYLFRGLSLADLAHLIVLREAGIVPAEAAGRLAAALLALHKVPAEEFAFDPALGDVYCNREHDLIRSASDAGGWLRTGRARREATNIAYHIAVRERLVSLIGALAEQAEAIVDLSARHIATIMPDYTYLQQAQPTSLAHYLLSFVFPILRDFDRLEACFRRVNACPGGIGSVNGTGLPLDRRRLAGLLGFEGVVVHTRDAMWQADMPVEITAGVVASMINLDRLAEDLQVWATREFDLVDLADEYCRASVIMPQKKNPYSLAFVRGAAGMLIGRLASMAAVGKTVSGQPDNRIFAYGEVPRSVDLAIQSARLLTGVVKTLTVNTPNMARRTDEGYSQATDLAELVMRESNVPYRTAHRLVGEVISSAARDGIPAARITSEMIDRAAGRVLGRDLRIPGNVVAGALDPRSIVASRVGLGGAAPEPLKTMIRESRQSIAEARHWTAEVENRLAEAEAGLLKTAGGMAADAPHQ
jgi:argininosuccinate lyase